MDAGGHPLGHRDAEQLELGGLVGVVRQQPHPVGAQRGQHLRGGGVVALVLAAAEGQVGLVGVEAGVLEGVGVELGVQADAAALLAQVQQDAAGVGDELGRLAQLRPAVAPLAAEHVAGQALAVRAHQRRLAAGRATVDRAAPVAQPEGQVLPAVGQAGEGEHLGGRAVPVGEAQRDGHPGADGRRRRGGGHRFRAEGEGHAGLQITCTYK
nr:hypothetical protein [Geodermatophilus dictyosporus]